jgi:uncharacterized membrane protein
MDYYSLIKFGHIVGFILLGGGLLAVFVSEFQAYRTSSIKVFAEAARYTAIFYDCLAISGALLVALSGFLLVLELGLGFFDEPWLVGMWGLFLFEFIEGNTVTRIQFRRTLRHSQEALKAGKDLTSEVRKEARSLLNQIAHFLDIPLFTVIVYCGTVRPDSWAHVLTAIGIGVVAAMALMILVPQLAAARSTT